MKARCAVAGCNRRRVGRLWCTVHYERVRRLGHPDAERPIATKKAHGSGYVTTRGYRQIRVDGRQLLEHRYVMEQQLGRRLLSSETVHHRNGDKLDNRPENLELRVRKPPSSGRVEDLVAYALEILSRYAPERLEKRQLDQTA